MDNRKQRVEETRAETAFREYAPPSTLPDPNPEEGYAFRWVATHVLGQNDPANVSKRFREGWEPVKAADHPELHLAATAAGNIEMGGLILCKAPIEMTRGRTEYYNRQAKAQIQSVNSAFMQNNDPRMPLFADAKSEETRGTFGSGNK
jgi:hypothetical protein